MEHLDRSPQSSGRPRRIAILGSTGSIGTSALDVIDRLPERLTAFALTARSNVARVAEQTLAARPRLVGLADPAGEAEFRSRVRGQWDGDIWIGEDAPERIAALPEVDLVLNGLVGASGLRPSWNALREGKPLALANKESLVIAGACLTREARRTGAPILPVDSEHNGLFQLLQGSRKDQIGRLILTASGGPFRKREIGTFDAISPEEALAHPTWKMGPRITIDSATLLNKGFEVMEARWLFDLDPEQITVWIHPQSIVHGLVEWVDGSTTAQLSVPDMRIPIQNALCHPDRFESGLPRCDLTRVGKLEFEAPEPRRYPCLGLAHRSSVEGTTAPAVLNAADEVLVASFLEGEIHFPQIAECLERVLDQRPASTRDDLEAVLEADAWGRQAARAVLARCR
jgi:1-deoxy-D-xylulose-5-phosphate reductoisomerase